MAIKKKREIVNNDTGEVTELLDEPEPTADPDAPHIKYVPTTRNLKCFLTEAEIANHAEIAANAEGEILALEDEFKAVKSGYTSQIDEKKSILHRHCGLVRSKFEFRETECRKFYNYTDRTVSVVRLDTYETIETRPMKDDEAQMELSDGELTDVFDEAV